MTNKKTIEELYSEYISKFPKNVNGANCRLIECSDLHCICKCKEYIQSWQGLYCKDGCKISKMINKMLEERIQHTLSCFILGFSLYEESELIHSAIDDVLKMLEKSHAKSNGTNKEAFFFAWFLTCIYHDFGYAYEKKIVDPEDFDFNKLLEENGCCRPTIFSNEIISRYAEYRCCRFCVKDHGIFGGAKLLKDLQNFDGEYSNFYQMAAQTIMVHNIYYCHKGDIYESCYKWKELAPLIVDDVMREHVKYPFLFLLSLVDNIEPIKRFEDIDVLSKVFIEIDNNDRCVKISFDRGFDSNKIENYKNSVKSMTDWLTDVKEYNNVIRITLPKLGKEQPVQSIRIQ